MKTRSELRSKMKLRSLVLVLLAASSTTAVTATLSLAGSLPPSQASQGLSVTRVGNGDDGSDLEGASPIKAGKILKAQKSAVARLKRLGVEGIAGLGQLTPETAKSTIYLSKVDSAVKLGSDQGQAHTDPRGYVFARTLPELHAPTRFFPVSEKLDLDQIEALHVHEALHRALPKSVREDEAIVSEITLSIVSPEASQDAIRETVNRLLPEADRLTLSQSSIADTPIDATSNQNAASVAPENSLASKPSLFGYEYRSYSSNDQASSAANIKSMHQLQSYLYPFGSKNDSFGFGIEASMVQTEKSSLIGPLGISSRVRLWSGRGFDVGIFGNVALNMLSAEELKNSPFGRDIGTVGISMRKDLDFFYVENFLSYSFAGSSTKKIGLIDTTFDYGGVVNAQVHAGASALGMLNFGGYAEIFLADHYRVSSNAMTYFDSGRYRLVSAGPEIKLRVKDVAFTVYGKFLLNAPDGINFDSLGNLMGIGAGQKMIGVNMSIYF